MLSNLLLMIHDDTVRDLAWSIFQPELLTGGVTAFTATLTNSRIEWLLTLDEQPQRLHRWVKQHHQLGHYYESLWSFFLSEDAAFRLIQRNKQITDQGRTTPRKSS